MEPDRTSLVLPHQCQLARRAVARLRNRSEVPRQHQNPRRPHLPSALEHHALSHEGQNHRATKAANPHQTKPDLAAVELHHLSAPKKTKLFLSAPLAPDDVFTPRNSTSVGTPFGEYHVGSDAHSWFRPLLLTHILCVPAMWWLCRRSGYSGWFSLAMLVPLANVLLLYFLAFAVWPVGQHSTGSSSAAGLRMDTAKEIQSEQNAAKP